MPEERPTRLALLLASIHTGASNELWSEIANLATVNHTSLFVFPGGRLECEENQEHLRNVIYPLVNADNIDGVLTWASSLGGSVQIEDVEAFLDGLGKLPCVSIGMKRKGFPVVAFDAYAGVQSVLLHCITHHQAKRIAFIRGPENHYSALDRYRAYCDTLDQTGLVLDPRLVSDPHPWYEGAKALLQLVKERSLVPGKDFDTIACASDLMMFDAGKALEALGYSIPKDIRIVGYNDSRESHLLRVPCTTARMPVTELAHMSFDLLLRLMKDKDEPSFDILLPSQPVIRQSCGCAYSLNSIEQAKQTLGTPSLFLAWLVQNFKVPHQNIPSLQQLVELAAAEEDDAFFSLAEKLVHAFLDRGGDPSLLSEALHWYTLFFSNAAFEKKRENALRDLFLRQCDLVSHQHAFTQMTQARSLDALKFDLLRVRSLSSIPELLSTHLSDLGLGAGYVVLHEDDSTNRFVGGYCDGGLLDQVQTFAKHLLLPVSIQEKLPLGVYVVEPLFMDNQPLGYAVFRTNRFSGSMLEEIRTALSSALKGTFLLDAANKAREESERAQRERTEFFANVSEGLRDPLEAILEAVQGSDAALCARIEEQVRSATHLLDLTLSYTDAYEMERTLVDVRLLLDHLAFKLPMEYQGSDSLPVVLADKARLQQACEIAVQYILQQTGSVICRTEVLKDGLEIGFESLHSGWTASLGSHDPSLSLAQRIILMNGGMVALKENRIIYRLSWPSLEGESIASASSVVTFIASESEHLIPEPLAHFEELNVVNAATLDKQSIEKLEGSIIAWDAKRTSPSLQLALYLLSHHPKLSKAPILCLNAKEGAHNLVEALASARQGEGNKEGLLVLHGSWDEGFVSALALTQKIQRCEEHELIGIFTGKKVSLLVCDSGTPSLFERLRMFSDAPIVVVKESWQGEEVERLAAIPRLLIAHRCVGESSDFRLRVLSLIAGDDLLPPLTSLLVKRAIVYIDQHASAPISRWQLAENVNVSEDYLTRIFRKETGLSPWDYLNRHRIHLAVKLLKQTTLSINEIASQTGFQDQAYFCRVFRKIKGCAPTKIRTN